MTMNNVLKALGRLFTLAAGSDSSAAPNTDPGVSTEALESATPSPGATLAQAAAALVVPRDKTTKLTPDQEKIKAALITARLIAQATAPTKIVRFVDHDGQIVWITGLSPQDAERNIDVLGSHGYIVLGVMDMSEAPRRPTWPIEYEDPQCYNTAYVALDDLSNFNLGTVELREQLLADGHKPAAVLRLTAARYSGPMVYVN